MTGEELKLKAERMQAYLEAKPENQDEAVIDRLENLQVLMAQSGELLAKAKYNLDCKKNDSITLALKEAMLQDWSVSVINKKIDALCREENFIVNWLDRINSSAVHQVDALRSILSYRKAQMQI